MFDDQDTENEEDCLCAEPFSTLPTLLHLKAMKNKLNIAYLSRDMMKWNSSNMENELKKIAVDISSIYENFSQKTKKAYLLLARCRYFNQEFYRNVREGIKTADMVVNGAIYNIAGVNMIHYTLVMQSTKPRVPYISRGGQTILEAKNAWTELLKSHIKMAELRHNFLAIESTYRNAYKRQHIIDQIILPKTQATIKYITTELEEINREESFRLKMMSKIKTCKNAKRLCPCTVPAHGKKDRKKARKEKKTEPLPKCRSLIDEPITIFHQQQFEPVIIPTTMPEIQKRSSIKLKSQQEINTLRRFYELASFHSDLEKEIAKKQRLPVGDCDSSLGFREIDKPKLALEIFLEVCKDVRDELVDNLTNKEIPIQLDSKLLTKLKTHVDTVINTNGKLLNTTVLSSSVKSFITRCGQIDVDMKIASKDIDQVPLDEIGKKRIHKLISNIENVAKIITECNKMDPSSLDEPKGNNEVKNNVDLKVTYQIPRVHKVDYLRKIESDVESLTADMTGKDIMKTSSIKQFLSSCKGFKKKLEEHKKDVHKLPKKVADDIQKGEEDLLSDSLIMFMASCEDYIKNTKNCVNLSPDMSNETFIAKISEMMTKWRKQGIVGKSTLEFMKTAKKRWTIDNNNSIKSEATSNGHFILSPKDESLEYTDASVKISACVEKARSRNLNNTSNFPSNYGDVNPYQSENCETTQIHPGQVLHNRISKHDTDKTFTIGDAQIKPLKAKGVEKTAQYPSRLIKKEANSTSQSSNAEEASRSLLTETLTSNESLKADSEMIVAEISTYDSCPVFEPNNFDVWLLETRCDSLSNASIDPSQESSSQFVENETCLVYSTEKPEDHTLKKTYTI